VVTLEHIGKRFGSGPQILADVSLAVQPGGFYCLTGAGGAGKTTLLRIITLAEKPSSGRMSLFGADPAALGRAAQAGLRRRIGIVFQDVRLCDELTVRDNVALPLRLTGTPEQRVRDNVGELLAWVGLAERGDMPAAALSGGERQRVAIARAIVCRPELLIADEPAGNVDDEVASLLVRIFEHINRLGATVLIATNDVAFADRFEHQRLHLEHGTLSAGGAAAGQ
jgi:cell division transport system ATP-binding protein